MESLTTAGAATFLFLQAGPSANWGSPSVSGGSDGGVDVNTSVLTTVAGAGTVSSCTPVVTGVYALSAHASVDICSTMCKSKSGLEVGDCVIVASAIRLSRLASTSSSFQTVSAQD